VKGNVFKTWINRKPAAHWIDSKNEYPKGFIGLQVHGGLQQFTPQIRTTRGVSDLRCRPARR